jgi:hypothetical protein
LYCGKNDLKRKRKNIIYHKKESKSKERIYVEEVKKVGTKEGDKEGERKKS